MKKRKVIGKFAQWLSEGLSIFLVFASCATPPAPHETDPHKLVLEACSPGSSIVTAKGSVWLTAHSNEASGRFPAIVTATAHSTLRMEITNLLGGTEAVIAVDNEHYTIHVPSKHDAPPKQVEEGNSTWGGIPLVWATRLFLGAIPCPSAGDLPRAKLSIDPSGELIVETAARLGHDSERFEYQFQGLDGKSWPKALHWERKGSFPLAVDFKFESPESGTRSPKRWEAKSSRGEVKARWQERDTTVKPE